MWCLSHGDLCVRDLFTAYKCRCTRKGPKIRYKDVQKLEIKPKHPYCQEKMILWVKCCTFVCFCPFMIDLSSLLLFCDISFFILLILCRLVFFSSIIYFIPWFPNICLSFSLLCLQKLDFFVLSHTFSTLSASAQSEFYIIVPGLSGQTKRVTRQ